MAKQTSNDGKQSSPGLEEYEVFEAEGRQGLELSLLQMYSALPYHTVMFIFCVRHNLPEVPRYRKWTPKRISAIINRPRSHGFWQHDITSRISPPNSNLIRESHLTKGRQLPVCSQ